MPEPVVVEDRHWATTRKTCRRLDVPGTNQHGSMGPGTTTPPVARLVVGFAVA